MISATSNALVQRRGSLIQRRNSKRFVLSELSAAVAAVAAVAADQTNKEQPESPSPQKDDYLTDFDGSDDDDNFKVPDIVLDILPEAPSSPITYCRDPTDTVEEVPEWKLLKLLKNDIA